MRPSSATRQCPLSSTRQHSSRPVSEAHAWPGTICRTAKCTNRQPARARVISIAVPVRCGASGDDRYNTRDANGGDTIIGLSTAPMIRIANAPCSWGILEFEGDATPASYATVLDEIRATGYSGTELGDWGFMPTDPAALHKELAARNLSLVGAFVPVALADPSTHAEGAATAVRTATLMRDAGAADAFIVLSDDNGRMPDRERHAGRITPEQGLSESQWATFASGAEAVARAVG